MRNKISNYANRLSISAIFRLIMIDMTGVKKTWPIFKTVSKSKCNLPNYPNPKLPKNIKLAIYQVQIIAELRLLKIKLRIRCS